MDEDVCWANHSIVGRRQLIACFQPTQKQLDNIHKNNQSTNFGGPHGIIHDMPLIKQHHQETKYPDDLDDDWECGW